MGLPKTFKFFGMSLKTNEPPPTVTLSPIFTFWIIWDPIPIQQNLPIFTLPAILAPGDM